VLSAVTVEVMAESTELSGLTEWVGAGAYLCGPLTQFYYFCNQQHAGQKDANRRQLDCCRGALYILWADEVVP
jgi:hypothetical protein